MKSCYNFIFFYF